MSFRAAVTLSVLLHVSLGALALIKPAAPKSGETTYYVDLIQMGSGRGGEGGSPGSAGAKAAPETAGAALIEEPAGSVRDLTVSTAPKSSFRYPDKEGKKKVEADKLITVVRKERPFSPQPAEGIAASRDGLITGISSSGGTGSGDGSGTGTYFPYAYYVDSLKNRISSSWYSSLVSPGLKGKYLVTVYFKIQRNGEIADLKIEKSSGNESLDLSSRRAVESAAPFAPLPGDFPYSFLIVHFEFEWEKQCP